jgi:hypothetical protein
MAGGILESWCSPLSAQGKSPFGCQSFSSGLAPHRIHPQNLTMEELSFRRISESTRGPMDAGQFDWMHSLEVFFGGLGAVATFFAAFWKVHSQDRKERIAQADRVAQAIEARDRKLTFILQEHPPHSHGEIDPANMDADSNEPLLRRNVHFPKIKIDGIT